MSTERKLFLMDNDSASDFLLKICELYCKSFKIMLYWFKIKQYNNSVVIIYDIFQIK